MTAYSVIRDTDGNYAVEAQSPEGLHVVGGFKTEHAAIEWMVAKQNADPPTKRSRA